MADLAQYASTAGAMALDWDGWKSTLPQDRQDAMDGLLATASDPERVKKDFVATQWLSEKTGLGFNFVHRNFDAVRAKYGVRENVPDWGDPATFDSWVQSEAASERDEKVMTSGVNGDNQAAQKLRDESLSAQAYLAGTQPKPMGAVDGYAMWQSANWNNKAYRAKNAGNYVREWMARYAEGQEDARVAIPVAEQVFPLLANADENPRRALAQVAPLFRGLTQRQKALALRYVDELGAQTTDSTAGQGTGTQMALAAGRMLLNTANSMDRGFARDRLSSFKFEEGQAVPPELLALPDNELLREYMTVPNAGKPLFGSGNLTAERAAALNKEAALMLGDLDTEAELQGIAQGKINPLRRDTWYEKMALGGAESIALMAAVSTGAGLAAVTAAYRNDAEEKLLASGISRQNASWMASIIGPAQGALDRLQLGMLKKVPGIAALLQRYSTNNLVLFAGRATGMAVAETGIELAQDQLVPALVQQLGTAITNDVPQLDWKKVGEEAWAQTPETLLVMLPLALLGAGGATVRDIKGADQLARDPDGLRMLGFSPEQIKTISESPEGEASTALTSTWASRKPILKGDKRYFSPGEAADFLAKAREQGQTIDGQTTGSDASEQTSEESADVVPSQEQPAPQSEPESGAPSGDVVSIRRDDQGWNAIMADGTAVQVGDAEAAIMFQQVSNFARDAEAAQANIEIIDTLFAQDQAAGRQSEVAVGSEIISAVKDAEGEVTVRGNRGDVVRELEMDEKSIQNLGEEMEALGIREANINGKNWLAGDIHKIEVNPTPEGVFTVLHERTEDLYKNGSLTKQDTQKAAAALAPIFQADKELAPRLQRIAAGTASEAEARETMVDLAVAELGLAGRKGKTARQASGLPAGALQTAIRGSIAANARDSGGLRKFAQFLNAVRRYMRALFSAAAKIRKARRDNVDLSDFDAFVDKVTGRDTQRDTVRETIEQAEAESEASPMEGSRAQPTTDAPVITLADGTQIVGPSTFSIRAYHGTPHKVDRFSTEKIGTGEGNQAFGWGIYFAESPAVAEEYRRTLGQKRGTQGNVYGVDILSDDSSVLLWDAPVTEQPESVQSMLPEWRRQRMIGQPETGWQLYEELRRYFAEQIGESWAGDREASEFLNAAGIKGIKYEDQLSRRMEDKTFNYVIFDENLIQIIEENGQPVQKQGATFSLRKRDDESYDDWMRRMDAANKAEQQKEKRQPEVMYHGSEYGKGRFRGNELGIHFGDEDAAQARLDQTGNKRGEVFPYLVDIKNPVVLRYDPDLWKPYDVFKSLPDDVKAQVEESYPYDPQFDLEPRELREELEKLGYDGIEYGNAFEGGTSYVAFSESQISEPPAEQEVTVTYIGKQPGIDEDLDLWNVVAPGSGFAGSTITTEAGAGEAEALRQARQRVEREEATFSLSPAQELDIYAERTRREIKADPKRRKLTHDKIQENLARLKQNWTMTRWTWAGDEIKPVVEHKSKRQLDFEQRRVRAQAFQDSLIAQGIAPTAATGTKDARDYEQWQRFQESKNLLMSRGMEEAQAEILAQASAEKWRKEDVAKWNRALKEAREAADAWRAEQDAMQQKDWNPRAVLKRAAKALDVIQMSAPAEVSRKVGGYLALLDRMTPKALHEEILRRIDKMGVELEKYYRKEYTKDMARLIERAKPKSKTGEKPKGHLGPDAHYLFERMQEAMRWDEAKVTGELAKIQATIDGGKLTAEEEARAMLEMDLVQLAGDWKNSDASRMAAAVEAAQVVYEGGYQSQIAKQLKKREEREADRTAAKDDSGTPMDPVELRKLLGEQEKRSKKLLGRWRDRALEFFDFRTKLEIAFGPNSKLARKLEDGERNASYQAEDLNQAVDEQAHDLFRSLAANGLEAEKIRYRLSQESIKNDRTDDLSEMEAIQAILMWRQPDGKRDMEAQGDGQEFVDTLEAGLSKEGRAVMDFLSTDYAAEYGWLNPVYRERHGVDLPKNPDYAPLTKEPMQIKPGMVNDPITGGLVPEGSFTPGSLKTRRSTTSGKIIYRDAMQVWLAHKRQLNHWVAYGEWGQYAAAVLGNSEVQDAIKAKAGPAAANAILKDIQGFMNGGFRDAAASLATAVLSRNLASRAATIHLAGNIGTRLIQATQAAAAIHEMPTASFVKRFSQLWSGQMGEGLWDAFNSPFIQRRIKQMPPVVRQAMEGMRSTKPNRVKYHMQQMMSTLTGTDAFFTASTYAIIKDYQMALGKRQGLSGQALEDYATAEAIRGTERVAQPTRMGTKSTFENTAQGAYRGLFMAYISEARQKLALAAYDLFFQKGNAGQKLRTAMLVWGIGGVMANVIRSAWRDWQDDDDEWTDTGLGILGFMDDKNWNLPRMMAASLAGPLNAVPFLGQAIEDAANLAVGGAVHSGNIVGNIATSTKAAEKLLTGVPFEKDEPVEESLKQFNTVMAGLGFFTDSLAAAASFTDVAIDTAKLMDAAYTDETEQLLKDAATQRKKDKEKEEAEDAKLTDEQRERKETQREERRRRKLEQDARRLREG